MTYYDTLDEDLKRAKEILTWADAHGTDAVIQPVDAGVAYKLLESFVAEIERLRAERDVVMAVLHDQLSELNAVFDPELSPALQARVDAVLANCDVAACAEYQKQVDELYDAQQELARLAALVEDLKRCSQHGDMYLPTSCKSCARIVGATMNRNIVDMHDEATRLKGTLQLIMQVLGPAVSDAVDYTDEGNLSGLRSEVNEALALLRAADIEYKKRGEPKGVLNRVLYLDGKGDTGRTPEEDQELKDLTTPAEEE